MEGVTHDDRDGQRHEFHYKEANIILHTSKNDSWFYIHEFMNEGTPGDGKKLLCYALGVLKEKYPKRETVYLEPSATLGWSVLRMRPKSMTPTAQADLEAYYAKYGFKKISSRAETMTASVDTVIAHCKSGGRIRSTRRKSRVRSYRKRGSVYSRGTRR